ncbi:MAG: URC4/urg3 family protein [Hyphomicrobiaceae bacterium]
MSARRLLLSKTTKPKAGHLTNTDANDGSAPAALLLSAKAVRERCWQVFDARAELEHFSVHLDRLEDAADYVIETTRQNYPSLDIPFHARWRHFTFAGVDRWQELAQTLTVDAEEMARIQFDLVIASVLLDAGAGADWCYLDKRTGKSFSRSEGLALASLDGFAAGLFSSSPGNNFQADALALSAIGRDDLGSAFQVTPQNPLVGLDGRVQLMRSVGSNLTAHPEFFSAEAPRIGGLFDCIKRTYGQSIAAAELLEVVLTAFGGIWPGRLEIDGVNLGDTWGHPAVAGAGETNGRVPFHKLSQWLTYSLIEPLQQAGIDVVLIDDLTGLAEYRNGGLFVDLGVLEVRDPTTLQVAHNPGDPLIVEWRALTIALLDQLADLVRSKLGAKGENLPLASILEGGTWAAGRRIASKLRDDGSPPIRIISDGSVF